MLDRGIRKRQIERAVRESGLAGIAFHHGEAGWNLLFIDVEEHDVAATNAYPDFGRSPEIDNALGPERNLSKPRNVRRRKWRAKVHRKRSVQVSARSGAAFSRKGTLRSDISIQP